MNDKDLIQKVLELGIVLGKGIEIQFTSFLPISASHESIAKDFSNDLVISSNIGSNWLSDVKQRLDEMQLSSTSLYQDCIKLADQIESRNIPQTTALSFGDTLDRWCKELSFSLTGKTVLLPYPTCPIWLGIGFFSKYLLCKMKLFPMIAPMTGLTADVLRFPRDTLADLLTKESRLTGAIDGRWAERIRILDMPTDIATVERFIQAARDGLRALNEVTLKPQRSNRVLLVLRQLIRIIPYLGPAVDAAIFGKQ